MSLVGLILFVVLVWVLVTLLANVVWYAGGAVALVVIALLLIALLWAPGRRPPL